MSNTNVTGGSFAIRAAAKACRRQLSGLVFAAGCDRNFQWDALSDKKPAGSLYRYVVCYPSPESLYGSDVHIKSQKCEIYCARTGRRNPLFLKFNYDYVRKKFMNRRILPSLYDFRKTMALQVLLVLFSECTQEAKYPRIYPFHH